MPCNAQATIVDISQNDNHNCELRDVAHRPMLF